jgi:hypothetical protein
MILQSTSSSSFGKREKEKGKKKTHFCTTKQNTRTNSICISSQRKKKKKDPTPSPPGNNLAARAPSSFLPFHTNNFSLWSLLCKQKVKYTREKSLSFSLELKATKQRQANKPTIPQCLRRPFLTNQFHSSFFLLSC